MNFSKKYGYVINKSINKECINKAIENSIYNWLSILREDRINYNKVELEIWLYFLNERIDEFPCQYGKEVAREYIQQDSDWYYKLDFIEFVCNTINKIGVNKELIKRSNIFLNNEFKRHNYAYRLVDNKIIEITDECEIKSIEDTLKLSNKNVEYHIQTALKNLSPSHSDYRNSIKESISAVECICRQITGESTLDRALDKLENKGIKINAQMKQGFEKLYYYTNDKTTGIRHALMDDTNTPSSDEAIYMLVMCSAFINYLIKKNI